VFRRLGAVLDGIAARQCRKATGISLVVVTSPETLVLIISRLEMAFEHGTLVDIGDVVGALVDGLLQEVDVPAVEEIAVEAVTGGVPETTSVPARVLKKAAVILPVGQREWLLVPVPLIVKVLDNPGRLHEEVYEPLRVALRADAVV